ncbi:MAG: hypothetical protein MUF34_03675 [Polyangiaceae bacterium]|nr:hypothetical protein [Polyangiaceae bacterium]
MTVTKRVLATLALSVSFLACSAPRPLPSQSKAAQAPPAAEAPAPLQGVELVKGFVVGEGKQFDNLTIFPVLAREQPDLGPFTTLEAALSRHEAEVREMGEGAQVNTLTVENKGKTPIFILAGTVLEGGKQDRQVGQDVVVGAEQAVNIDAFCVEQGRWTASRAGRVTGGKFGPAKVLADSSVRTAGQYKKNQSEVWSEVSKVNGANHKESASSALAASLDDAELRAERERAAGAIGSFFDDLKPANDAVGFAYAVDGKVRGVRWFVNHQIFGLFRGALTESAAAEASTARRAAKASATPPPPAPRVAATDVRAFLDEVDKAPVAEERATAGENVNTYRESKSGYGSKVKFSKARLPSSSPTPAAADVTLSSDFVSKKEGPEKPAELHLQPSDELPNEMGRHQIRKMPMRHVERRR